MKVEDCFEFGHVARVHGYKGEVVLILDVSDPSEYEELDSFFILMKGTLVPYFVEDLRLQGNKAVVKLEDVNSEEAAQGLVGNTLYLPLDNLPQLEEGQFYYHDVIGYQVIDKTLGSLGVVSNVYEFPHQDLIAMNYQGKEVLIPINDEIVLRASFDDKRLHVNLPEGLLGVYLDETPESSEGEEEE